MRNYFKYEFKKNLPFIIIASVIFVTILAIYLLTSDFVFSREEYINGKPTGNMIDIARNSPIGMITTFAYILVFVVIIKNFNFKMKKTAVDVYYQLPIKKKNMYLVKYLEGILEIIITFSACILLSFIILAIRPNIFELKYLFLYYLIEIPYIIIMYTIVTFVFIKGNTIIDGLVNVGMYIGVSFLLPAMLSLIFDGIEGYTIDFEASKFSIVSPMTILAEEMDYSLCCYGPLDFDINIILMLIINIILGVAAGVLLYKNEDKAEDVAQISNSYFSYKVLLPALIFLISVMMTPEWDLTYILVFILIAAYIGYVIYRRTFKITKNDAITIFIALLSGGAIGLMLYSFIY